MISAKFRFHGHGSLRYLFKNAQAVRSRYVTVKFIANPRRKKSRFSVVVSKKVHKSAVGRNRIRRRLYEIIRHEQQSIVGIYDVAVIVTSGEVLGAEHEELKASICEIFTRAGMYNSSH